MPRLSSTSSGTDITVEPKLISKPVAEMTDEELLEEVTRLRGARGVTYSAEKVRAAHKPPTAKKPEEDPNDIEEFG